MHFNSSIPSIQKYNINIIYIKYNTWKTVFLKTKIKLVELKNYSD